MLNSQRNTTVPSTENRTKASPVAVHVLQLPGGKAHAEGALAGDEAGRRALWTRLIRAVWKQDSDGT